MPTIPLHEESMSAIERGRSRYQQKDYEGALAAFSEAVKQSGGSLKYQALDYRAATKEKMGDLKGALRDGKAIVEGEETRAKGYLRVGKVLQIMGKKQLALSIYERGLGKVKIGTDTDRAMLQKVFNRLREELDPGKSRDPLGLPLELVEMIIQYLATRDRVVCLAVSKPWKRILDSSHKLWTTFDTTATRKSISLRSIRAHLKRSAYTLDNAIIHSRAHFDADRWMYIIKNCKKLTRIQVIGSFIIGDSLTSALPLAHSLTSLVISAGCQIRFTAVIAALTACQKTIVEAVFHNVDLKVLVSTPWPKLERLETLLMDVNFELDLPLTRNPGILDIDILPLIPNITSLSLTGWPFQHLLGRGTVAQQELDLSQWTKLEYFNMSRNSMKFLPKLSPTLKSLVIDKCRDISLPSHSEGFKLDFPLLEVLSCQETNWTPPMINALISSSKNLTTLLLGDRVEDPGALYHPSPTVHTLSLRYLSLAEDDLIAIVKRYPNVRNLDVSATRVTGVSVKLFVEMGVQKLKLNDCRGVGADAVEWARGKGVDVGFRFATDESRGWLRGVSMGGGR